MPQALNMGSSIASRSGRIPQARRMLILSTTWSLTLSSLILKGTNTACQLFGQVVRPGVAGRYTYRTVSSDSSNPDLHGQRGILEVSPYRGDNPLLKHGPLRVASDQRYFEHTDGTHFLWLGDTWWMGLCHRLRWPEDFQKLAADRASKGFTVVQIVAGLYPDMPPFDPRGANEAGFPWEENYARINPHYFDMADLRIRALVDRGLAPCIVGCWGYFMIFMGLRKIKQHWRNIVARWGAYPVFWCLAGEGTMPYYLSKNKEEDAADQ